MELTPEEVAFLRNYRQLSEHDRGYVDAMLEALEKDQKKRRFEVREGGRNNDK